MLLTFVWVIVLAPGAKAFNCSMLRQAIPSHGPGSVATSALDSYFVNISSFQNESTYTYSPGKPYQITVLSRNTSFVGFLLHATSLNGTIVGQFVNLSSNTQYSSCSDALNSVSLNLTTGSESSVELTWKAPDVTGIGPILFRVTVSQTATENVFSLTSEIIHEAIQAYIVVANQRYIRKVDIPINNSSRSFSSTRINVTSVNYHLKQNLLFWTDLSSSPRISCTWLETDLQTIPVTLVANSSMISPSSVAVDWINDKLYWTDVGTSRIEVAELTGRNRSVLVHTALQQPRGLVVDPIRGWMYWVDQRRQVVERASMDGTSRSIIHSTGLVSPVTLALDADTQILYWIDNEKDQLECSSVNGSNRRTIITGSLLSNPTYGLDVFQNTVYWTNSVTKTLYSTTLKTPKIIPIRSFVTGDGLYEMAFVAPSKQAYISEPNPCNDNNGGCSQLCLLSSNSSTGYGCACITGQQLAADGRECIVPKLGGISFILNGLNTFCGIWISTDRFPKMFGVSSAVAVAVEDLCQCNFTPVDIVVSFRCHSTTDRCVNVSLLYNTEINNHDISRFVDSWVESYSNITVLREHLNVTNECTQLPALTTPSHVPAPSVDVIAIIWGVAIGVPVSIILTLVVIAITVYCVKKKKHQNAARQDFEDNISEIISNFNTQQDAEEQMIDRTMNAKPWTPND